MGGTTVPKSTEEILFLIIQNMNIEQVAHSLVVIEVEIVIHARVGREAQQGEDCRNENKLVQVQACKQRDSSMTVVRNYWQGFQLSEVL